jgi:hypothetical protein
MKINENGKNIDAIQLFTSIKREVPCEAVATNFKAFERNCIIYRLCCYRRDFLNTLNIGAL